MTADLHIPILNVFLDDEHEVMPPGCVNHDGRVGPADLSETFWSRKPSPALALCAALLAAMIGEEAKPSPPSTVTP